MRSLNPAFTAAVASGTSSLTRIWTITRRDGTIYRYTDLDVSLVIGGDTYVATTAFQITDVEHTLSGGAQTANMKVTLGTNPATEITHDDVRDGRFNFAQVKIEVVIWDNLAAGSAILLIGNFGNIELSPLRRQAQIEIVGRLESALQGIGEFYSPECRADLGDTRCGVNLASHTTTGTVDSFTSTRKFIATFAVNPNNFEYSFGKMTWTSGNNNGIVQEILQQISSGATQEEVILALNAPRPIQIGDTFSIHKGCDFRPVTCFTRFNNILNFRGEPHVPGPDFIADKQEEL